MELTHPAFLWLLATIIPAVAIWRRSRADLPAPRRIASLVCRVLALVAVALALAGLRWIRHTDRATTLFLVDASHSIAPEALAESMQFAREGMAALAPGDMVGLIGFAAEPVIWVPPAAGALFPETAPPLPESAPLATDIGAALDFAAAVFPEGASRRILLIGDGNDTAGRGADTAARLAAEGIRVDTAAAENPQTPEVLVESVEIPANLIPGEPFTLGVPIRSNVETNLTVRLSAAGFILDTKTLRVTPGRSRAEFPNLKAPHAFTTYTVELVAARDTESGNNRAMASAGQSGGRRVLLVDSEPGRLRATAGILEQAGLEVEVRPPEGLPASISGLEAFDLLILSDVPAERVGIQRMQTIADWVSRLGGGFMLAGGESSFGSGGYADTAIERILPVRMEQVDREERPTVALLVSLDRSGSMQAAVAGQTKMSLANQGAVLAMEVLGPRDLFGLHAVDTRVHEVVPIIRDAAQAAAAQRILSVASAGGGIYIYTALRGAERALDDSDASVKHLILFADAADAEEKVAGEMGDGSPGAGSALDLAAAMNARGITTSVVALGSETDRDTSFLSSLANRGGGRFYLTGDALSLPQIFTTETLRVTQSSLFEDPFLPMPGAPSKATAGIDWSQTPFLLGHNMTQPKPTAEILLSTEGGAPLLAIWRHGLGMSAAFTSDLKDRWAADWLLWPGYAQFLSQTVRTLLPGTETGPLSVQALQEGTDVRLILDAVDRDGRFIDNIDPEISATDFPGAFPSVRAQQTAPGRYEVVVPGPDTGSVLYSVSAAGLAPAAVAVARNYPEELLALGTNRLALAEIATRGGGRFIETPTDAGTAERIAAQRRHELWPALLTLAGLLILADLAVRRLRSERENPAPDTGKPPMRPSTGRNEPRPHRQAAAPTLRAPMA